jgi:hypothetical protein
VVVVFVAVVVVFVAVVVVDVRSALIVMGVFPAFVTLCCQSAAEDYSVIVALSCATATGSFVTSATGPRHEAPPRAVHHLAHAGASAAAITADFPADR